MRERKSEFPHVLVSLAQTYHSLLQAPNTTLNRELGTEVWLPNIVENFYYMDSVDRLDLEGTDNSQTNEEG